MNDDEYLRRQVRIRDTADIVFAVILIALCVAVIFL